MCFVLDPVSPQKRRNIYLRAYDKRCSGGGPDNRVTENPGLVENPGNGPSFGFSLNLGWVDLDVPPSAWAVGNYCNSQSALGTQQIWVNPTQVSDHQSHPVGPLPGEEVGKRKICSHRTCQSAVGKFLQ